VLDLAVLDDCQADQVVDLILPKFIPNSGLNARAFQAIASEMHRDNRERVATRN